MAKAMQMTDQKLTDEQRAEIRSSYKKLLAATAEVRQEGDVQTLRQIYRDASQRVELQTFKAPHFASLLHSLQTAYIVADELALGRAAVVAALCYDLLQQAPDVVPDIEKTFGQQTSPICHGLLKVGELYNRNVSIEDENFRKLLFSFAQDVRVILVILADRLNTMRHLKHFTPSEQMRIGTEVGRLYAPMAHRMGLYSIKSEMEDLAMKFTDNEVYLNIAHKLNETKRDREVYIDEFIKPVREALTSTNLKFEIKGRTKTISSIYNKLRKTHADLDTIYDLFAIRVIIDCPLSEEKAQCWRVYSMITDMYQPNPVRLKDWISVPKGNGYESLHITVLGPRKRWVEVQIRTKRMDEVAEKGFAAHWKYKGIKTEQSMELWLANIREVLENPELTGVDFVDDFKLNLYDKEVFAFTPKGDLRRLAKGATVLDFAYDIHTNVGNHCVGAIVNERNVSIRHVIQNGDQVEILTNAHQEPKQDWLSFVVTSRAKTKLRQALKEQIFSQSEIGRELLLRRLKNWKHELTDSLLNQLTKAFGYKDIHVFLCDVGNEKISSTQIKEFIDNASRKDEVEVPQKSISAENYKHLEPDDVRTQSSGVLMLDRGLSDVEYQLARCCKPIFGDNVFAFCSTSGVRIHRCGCPNESEMRRKYGYRILEARWIGTEGNLLPVTLRVTGTDDIGIVTNVTQIISKNPSFKMRSITVNSTEGGFEGDVTVLVSSSDLLSSLVKKIAAIKGVYSVARIENI